MPKDAALLPVANEAAEALEEIGGEVRDGSLGVGSLMVHQLAHDQSSEVRVPTDDFGLRFHQASDTFFGGHAGGEASPDALDEGDDDAAQHLAIERFLVLEVVVEESAVDAGGGADVLDRGARIALLGEQAFGGVENGSGCGWGGRHGH